MSTAPFTILSGFIGTSVNGNSLSIPDSGWGNGILEFTGPLSTLSVSVENGNNSAQALTFAYNPSACSTMVTSNADSGAGSLRDAIACVAPGDTVTFSPSLTGQTIVLTTTEIAADAHQCYYLWFRCARRYVRRQRMIGSCRPPCPSL